MFLGSSSIDCYTCTSRNETDPYCEDAMAPAFVNLEVNCKVPKPGHVGKYPALFCVKMIGESGIFQVCDSTRKNHKNSYRVDLSISQIK